MHLEIRDMINEKDIILEVEQEQYLGKLCELNL